MLTNMNNTASMLLSALLIIGVAIISLVLIFCGKAVIKQPSLLSGYSSFTDSERTSYAFKRYLKAVSNALIAMAALLMGGTLASVLTGSSMWVSVFVVLFLAIPFYVLYFQSLISLRLKRRCRLWSGVIFLVLIGIVSFTQLYPNTISLTNHTLHISGWYGETVPDSQIVSVDMKQSLPEIVIRTNGISWMGFHRGYFRTSQGQTVKLLVSGSHTPFLHIVRKGGVDIYTNGNSSVQIEELYRALVRSRGSAPTKSIQSVGH